MWLFPRVLYALRKIKQWCIRIERESGQASLRRYHGSGSWMGRNQLQRMDSRLSPLVQPRNFFFFFNRNGNSIRKTVEYMCFCCLVRFFIFTFYDAAVLHPQGKSEFPICLQTLPFIFVQGMWVLAALLWEAPCFRPWAVFQTVLKDFFPLKLLLTIQRRKSRN